MLDLFPARGFDPDGLHELLWSRIGGRPYHPGADKPLTLSAYDAGGPTCYVEPTSVGNTLAELPLFLAPGRYVNVPLNKSYLSAYQGMPKRWQEVLESN